MDSERDSAGTQRDSVGTVEDLHASATRITGLADFGADDYRDGLAVLLESYARDAGLTPLGRKVKRSFLRGALVARLLSEAAWQHWPAHADVSDRAPDLRHRAAPDRHHGAAPAARRRPRAPRAGDVAHPGARAAPAAGDLGGQPGVPADPGGLRAAPRRASRVHGRALHGGRPGGGVLAAAAAVDAVGLLRVPGPPADLLALAARAGLDRRLPQAPAQPAAHRPARPRPPLGAEEPQPPVRARRAARRLPGRAGDPDAPRAPDRDRVGVQPRRAGFRGLVDHLHRRR